MLIKRLIAGAALLVLAGGAVAQQWVVMSDDEAEHINDSMPDIPIRLSMWTGPKSGYHVSIRYPSPHCYSGKVIEDDKQAVSLNGVSYNAIKACAGSEEDLEFNYFANDKGDSDVSRVLEEIKTDKPIVVKLRPAARPIVFMNPNGKWMSETVKVPPYDMGGM